MRSRLANLVLPMVVVPNVVPAASEKHSISISSSFGFGEGNAGVLWAAD